MFSAEIYFIKLMVLQIFVYLSMYEKITYHEQSKRIHKQDSMFTSVQCDTETERVCLSY